MSNLLAPVGRQRAITDLGVVAPGAKLFTYVSGTPATPLATTSDAAGLVPNANPIVASAGGLFGPIYLPAGVAYHWVLTDAAGLPIWDQDPVTAGIDATGNLTVGGVLTVTGFGTHLIQAAGAGAQTLIVQNLAPGPGNSAQVCVGNDANATLAQLAAFSSTFTPGSVYLPNGVALTSAGAGGLVLNANAAGSALKFATVGAERVRIDSAGTVMINTTTPAQPAQLALAANLATVHAAVLQNTNAVAAGNFLLFVNSAGTAAGGVQHTSAGTVAFNTSSDARLKTDRGPAVDLTALRALRVHDFAWIADGQPDRGVFAQEAHAHWPRAVSPGTDATTAAGDLVRPWMIDYSKFVADLIVGWQQHDATLAAIRADLERRR
jgi:Chaperone of endosialidase